ncbi:MAG: glycosyltransferase [Betaproteobacteria bacterium]|nr:glycosyltransferase [Betaproteobacteria bacterium]
MNSEPQRSTAKTPSETLGAGIRRGDEPDALPPALPDGRPWPLISIVLPFCTPDGPGSRTLDSILAQGYPGVEPIIVAPVSAGDATRWPERYRSSCKYVASAPDPEKAEALNAGFKHATGEILYWLDHGDELAPGALAAVAMAFFVSGSDLVSGISEVYDEGQLVGRRMTAFKDGPLILADFLDLEGTWKEGGPFHHAEVFFSRSLWEKVGGYARKYPDAVMEYELWCRFARLAASLHVVGAPLARVQRNLSHGVAECENPEVELARVRDHFAGECSSPQSAVRGAPARADRHLRVAIVNDVGAFGGAGTAQSRIAAAIEMAGHHVAWFDFVFDGNVKRQTDGSDAAEVVSRVEAMAPDIVLFGNLHGANTESIDVVEALGARFDVYWVMHDFWLLTGRCAYMGTCTQHLTGCDDNCPSATQYPVLAPARIANAWRRKRAFLASENRPFSLAPSQWAYDTTRHALSTLDSPGPVNAGKFRLGAPVHSFKPMDREAARRKFGIAPSKFVIAFGAAALGDERKGGIYALEALRTLNVSDVVLLTFGYMDRTWDLPGVQVLPLGFVSDPRTLVAAYSASDLFLGPSLAETFGQVFAEAALAGVPSVGFNQTGVKDAVKDGVTGWLVERSADALRAAILKLYHDRELCAQLGRWAAIYAANEFSLEACYHSLFNVWQACGLVDRLHLPRRVEFSPSPEGEQQRMVIVTPTHNAATLIDETIRSVVSQRGTFRVRYHVQDRGSTDGTTDILRKWQTSLATGNPLGGAQVEFSWASEADEGLYDAVARGFEHALARTEHAAQRATTMTWVNPGGILVPGALHTAACFFSQTPSSDWITGMGAIVHGAEGPAVITHEPAHFRQRDIVTGRYDGRKDPRIQTEGTFWRHSLWQQRAHSSPLVRYAADSFLWRQFAAKSPLIKLEVVLGYRRSDASMQTDWTGYYAELDAFPPIPYDPRACTTRGYHALYNWEASWWKVIASPRTKSS